MSVRTLRYKSVIICGVADPSGVPAPMGEKTKYNDNFLDLGIMWLFAKKMSQITGKCLAETELKRTPFMFVMLFYFRKTKFS